MKLNNSMRDEIVRRVIDITFKERRERFLSMRNKFAALVYSETVPEEHQRLMEQLPSYYFHENQKTVTKTIYVGGQYANVEFTQARVPRQACDSSYGHYYLFAASSKVGKAWQQLSEEKQKLNTDIATVRTNTYALLRSVTTVKKLLEVWPEVRLYVPDSLLTTGASKKELAVPASDLNEQLKKMRKA